YVELTVPAQGFGAVLLFGCWSAVMREHFFSIPNWWLALVMVSLLTALGFVGVTWRWPWPLRLLAYAACLATWIRGAGGWSFAEFLPGVTLTLPWYVDAT